MFFSYFSFTVCLDPAFFLQSPYLRTIGPISTHSTGFDCFSCSQYMYFIVNVSFLRSFDCCFDFQLSGKFHSAPYLRTFAILASILLVLLICIFRLPVCSFVNLLTHYFHFCIAWHHYYELFLLWYSLHYYFVCLHHFHHQSSQLFHA